MKNFIDCFNHSKYILMEGALGERLKREYQLEFDFDVVMASLIYSQSGRCALRNIWHEYAEIAYNHGLPFIATTPTRRVNRERVERSEYSESIIRDNVDYLNSIKKDQRCEMYIGGMIGCAGDAYTGKGCLIMKDSEEFHSWEINRFARTNVDFLYAALIPSLGEAQGIAKAASRNGIPYIISFTIMANGRLIDGTPISKAISLIDNTVTMKPICYMTNCVHPDIVNVALKESINNVPQVKQRFLGIQANTSRLSYEELDNAVDLKTSNPDDLAKAIMRLESFQQLKIVGGCCGTDGRHMNAIADKLKDRQ